MPRSSMTRSLLALLPIFGAALAAVSSMEGWPLLPSLLALVMIGIASAVIFWSGPLERATGLAQLVVTPLPVHEILPPQSSLTAESAPQELMAPEPAPAAEMESEPLLSSTRAELLAGERATQDLLTGLFAPEFFFSRFTERLAQCSAAGQTAVLVICDLDRFGELNRTAGLANANRLLRAMADAFRLTVREGDLLARLGGDEFALFFPGLSPEIAESRVRDLRAAVREAALQTLEEKGRLVTVSVGISCFPRDGETGEAMFDAADYALQAAKRLRAEQASQPVPSAVVLTRVEPLASRAMSESY
jgi:diguanylate cyclase (GGDEF)-like protein